MPDRRRAPSGYDATPESYLQNLQANDISHGVLVQPSFLGTDNSYLVASLLRHPDRFRGIAVVDPEISGEQLDKLQEAGVVGIRLNLIGLPRPDFGSPAWTTLLDQVQKRDWQVEVHRAASELQAVIEPLLAARVRVVVDHFGRPDERLGVDDPGFQYLLSLGDTRRVWVKLSASYRNGSGGRGDTTAVRAVPLLRKAFGLNRLVWGSDWPHTLFEESVSYSPQRMLLEQWFPNPADRQVVLLETPARLFSFIDARV